MNTGGSCVGKKIINLIYFLKRVALKRAFWWGNIYAAIGNVKGYIMLISSQ